MSLEIPAISLAAMPGRRNQILEFAKESEERGFSGIFMNTVLLNFPFRLQDLAILD